MLSPCKLATAAAAIHRFSTNTRIPLLLADPRQSYPPTIPQFEGELVAVSRTGSGYITGAHGLCYLLIGTNDGPGLVWSPVSITAPFPKLDCTGHVWTPASWLLCGLM
jgi:hypothetical protein